MPGDGPLPLKFSRHHNGRKMSIVVAHDFNVGVLEPSFNELAYVGWIHAAMSAGIYSWARSVPVKNQASQRRALFVYDIRPEVALACRS